jgi:hypothetical protein
MALSIDQLQSNCLLFCRYNHVEYYTSLVCMYVLSIWSKSVWWKSLAYSYSCLYQYRYFLQPFCGVKKKGNNYCRNFVMLTAFMYVSGLA